jgi:hypothetical protein
MDGTLGVVSAGAGKCSAEDVGWAGAWLASFTSCPLTRYSGGEEPIAHIMGLPPRLLFGFARKDWELVPRVDQRFHGHWLTSQ